MADDFTAEKLSRMDAAVVDERLTDLDVRLFWKMASAADRATRIVRRKQSAYAEALNVTRRAVQLSMDRLSAYGYVAPKTNNTTGSRSYVSAYEIAPKANLRSHFAKRSEPRFEKKRTTVQKHANRHSHMFPCIPLMSLRVRVGQAALKGLAPSPRISALGSAQQSSMPGSL